MTRQQLCTKLSSVLHWGILFLLVATPLAFGTVHVWAFSLMELAIFLLVAIWMILNLLQPQTSVLRQMSPSILWPIALFVALIFLQLVALPPPLLKLISPNTYALYDQAHAGLFSSWSPLSLNPSATRLELHRILASTAMFFLVFIHFRDRGQVKRLVITLILVGSFISLLGLFQYYSGTKKIYWFRDTSYASPFGPYVNRNHFAGYMAMLLPLGIGYFLARASRLWDRLRQAWKHGHLARRLASEPEMNQGLLLLLCLLVMAGALFISLSRGGVLSFLGAMVFLGLLLASRRLQAGWGRGFLALCALMALAILWFGIDPLLARFAASVDPQELTLREERFKVLPILLHMASSFPALGVGLAAFSSLFPLYQAAEIKSKFLQAHSDWLQLLTDTGGIGVGLALWFLVAFGICVLRRWGERRDPFVRMVSVGALAGIVGIVFHSVGDFNLQIPANALLLATLLALALGTLEIEGRPVRRKRLRRYQHSDEVPFLPSP